MFDDPVALPYHIDGIQFAADLSGVTIQYSNPDEVRRDGSEFRQRTIPLELDGEIDDLVAGLQASICELLDLHSVIQRQPAERVPSRSW